MNSTGQHGEKASYRIILLLVVGLTAFSSAMKELNQLQEFSLEASRLVAEWSGKMIPGEAPQTVTTTTEVSNPLTCENKDLKQSAPSVELPWLDNDAEPNVGAPARIRAKKHRPAVEQRSRPTDAQVVRLRELRRLNLNPVELEVRILSEHDAEADAAGAPEIPIYTFKTRSRKHSPARFNPRDREILLKSLNRSINLRTAG